MKISKLTFRITPDDLGALGGIIMKKAAPALQKLPAALRRLRDLQLRLDGETLEIGITLFDVHPLIPETELRAGIALAASSDGDALLVELRSISAWDMKTAVFNSFIMDKISGAVQKYPGIGIDGNGRLRIDLDETLGMLPLPCELSVTGRLTNVSTDENGIEFVIGEQPREKASAKRRRP